MNIKLKKAFRDLLLNKARTALVVLALVIGLWGLGSISVSYTILKNDLTENYKRTKPAHAILTSKNFERLDLNDFRKKSAIESAEFRDLSMERIEVLPDEWVPLCLFAVDDFHHFLLSKLYHETRRTTPAPTTLLLERNRRLISMLETGSVARF